MVRLIDADAIEHCLVIGGRRHGKTIISEIIRRAIQTAPTVDAVPVSFLLKLQETAVNDEAREIINEIIARWERERKEE